MKKVIVIGAENEKVLKNILSQAGEISSEVILLGKRDNVREVRFPKVKQIIHISQTGKQKRKLRGSKKWKI